jgi:hypothetical protein
MGEAIITRRGGSGGESIYTDLMYATTAYSSTSMVSVFPPGAGAPGSEAKTWTHSAQAGVVAVCIVSHAVGDVNSFPLKAITGSGSMNDCAIWLTSEPVNFSTSTLDCSMWYDEEQKTINIRYVHNGSTNNSVSFVPNPASITTYYK